MKKASAMFTRIYQVDEDTEIKFDRVGYPCLIEPVDFDGMRFTAYYYFDDNTIWIHFPDGDLAANTFPNDNAIRSKEALQKEALRMLEEGKRLVNEYIRKEKERTA